MDDIGSLPGGRLAQELVARVAPADALQRDLDAGVALLELVERRAHLLLFRVVEAEGEIHRLLGHRRPDRERDPEDQDCDP